jgi:hypothetical protein
MPKALSKITAQLIMLVFFLVINVNTYSFAQTNTEQANIDKIPEARLLYHENVMNAYNLPAAGDLIEMRVQLLNTKDITIPMFAIITHDDRLMTIQAEKVFLNQFNNVEYNFRTFAPIGKLQYQFFSQQEDGSAIISTIFNVERECRHPIAAYKIDLPDTLRGLERASKVIDTTQGLERDIKAYDHALDLISRIKEELNLIKQR